MPLIVPPLQALPVGLLIFVGISLAAAGWVWLDARARFPRGPGEGWVWAAGTLVALPIFLPIYLIGARPIGHVTACPSCGRGTLSHRATCLHCGHPITFESFPTSWGLGEVVGVATVLTVSLRAIAQAIGVEEMPTLVSLSLVGVAQNGLFLGLVVYVARIRYRQSLAAIGLRLDRWLLLGAVGVIIGAVTIPISTAAEQLAVQLVGLFVGPQRAEAMAATEHASNILTALLQGPLNPLELTWIIVLVCVLVPVGEEVFFRGFVYGTLRRWGFVRAVAFSSLVFAVSHLQIVHFLPIIVLGAVLALLYERTGSLVASIAVHAINNLVAVLSVVYTWNI